LKNNIKNKIKIILSTDLVKTLPVINK